MRRPRRGVVDRAGGPAAAAPAAGGAEAGVGAGGVGDGGIGKQTREEKEKKSGRARAPLGSRLPSARTRERGDWLRARVVLKGGSSLPAGRSLGGKARALSPLFARRQKKRVEAGGGERPPSLTRSKQKKALSSPRTALLAPRFPPPGDAAVASPASTRPPPLGLGACGPTTRAQLKRKKANTRAPRPCGAAPPVAAAPSFCAPAPPTQ